MYNMYYHAVIFHRYHVLYSCKCDFVYMMYLWVKQNSCRYANSKVTCSYCNVFCYILPVKVLRSACRSILWFEINQILQMNDFYNFEFCDFKQRTFTVKKINSWENVSHSANAVPLVVSCTVRPCRQHSFQKGKKTCEIQCEYDCFVYFFNYFCLKETFTMQVAAFHPHRVSYVIVYMYGVCSFPG